MDAQPVASPAPPLVLSALLCSAAGTCPLGRRHQARLAARGQSPCHGTRFSRPARSREHSPRLASSLSSLSRVRPSRPWGRGLCPPWLRFLKWGWRLASAALRVREAEARGCVDSSATWKAGAPQAGCSTSLFPGQLEEAGDDRVSPGGSSLINELGPADLAACRPLPWGSGTGLLCRASGQWRSSPRHGPQGQIH